jgi:hypothetical protein
MFWGEAMGDSMPPMFEARAIPKMSALDMSESEGRFRSIGYVCQQERSRAEDWIIPE